MTPVCDGMKTSKKVWAPFSIGSVPHGECAN